MPPDIAQQLPTLTAGGTAGLILGLVILAGLLISGRLEPPAHRIRAEAREERALTAGAAANARVDRLTDELEANRKLIEGIVADRRVSG